jgi:diguanylate cyclase (GGDEF)-like protein
MAHPIKHISIKLFSLIIFISLFLGGSYLLYKFFDDSKNVTERLLEENIQYNLLNVKYFLDKNFKKGNINQIKSYLDTMVYSNNMISDIHIISDTNELLYSTDNDFFALHKKIKCVPIANIVNSKIFDQQCYSFSIKLFNKLTPYYYTSNVYLNKNYLDSLVKNKILKYFTLFFAYFFLFMLFLWFIINKLLIKPLHALYTFAYSPEKIPETFSIEEFESIRHSLDVTFRRLKKEQKELFNLSTKDPLSGLYNRFSLTEKINWLISKNRRDKKRFALLFLDLDNFKNINDSKGHEFGDKVLKHIAEVLLSCVRDNDIVSRLGGDEFVVILPDLKDEKTIIEVIHRIQKMLAQPVTFENYKYTITCSIGVTIYPKDGKSVTELLKNADIAMYKSKELGKNNFHFFTENLNQQLQEKIKIQRMMVNALENGYFQLYYQPKVDIKSNKIVGCEALIRLIDPREGLIPPDKFIPVAEENNFIIPLGDWVIQQAVKQLNIWKESEYQDIKISINISGIQFKEKNFFEKLKNETQSIERSRLDLELTESILMDNFDEKIEIIHQLKALGFTLSLDDFGTGYSSLSYLKKIPFNTLKIDKSFIDDIEDSKEQTFVNMIVKIAKELKLEVVAEGVEDAYQLQYLTQIECEQYQGYFCSKPLPAKDFERLFLSLKCP